MSTAHKYRFYRLHVSLSLSLLGVCGVRLLSPRTKLSYLLFPFPSRPFAIIKSPLFPLCPRGESEQERVVCGCVPLGLGVIDRVLPAAAKVPLHGPLCAARRAISLLANQGQTPHPCLHLLFSPLPPPPSVHATRSKPSATGRKSRDPERERERDSLTYNGHHAHAIARTQGNNLLGELERATHSNTQPLDHIGIINLRYIIKTKRLVIGYGDG